MALAHPSPVDVTSRATTTAEASPLCILRVEDDDARADFVIDAFDDSRLQEALQQLATIPVDVVLLDLTLPDAFDLLGVNAIRTAAPDLALVVLTGSLDGHGAPPAPARWRTSACGCNVMITVPKRGNQHGNT